MKEEEVKAILLSGEDMVARCHENDAKQLTEGLNRLRARMYDTRNKAERRKVCGHYSETYGIKIEMINLTWL